MEITYILLGEILGILLLFQFFSSWIVISITLFSLGTVYFFTKKKSILIYIIPILFVIRLVFGVHSGDFDYLENIRLKVELNRGVGKVLKIDNKNLKNLTFIYLSELADGKYNVLGEFKELEKKENIDIISINRLEVEKLEDSFLEKYFKNRVESFIEKGDRYFKRVYRAIILGESREIPKELREKFNYVGVSHLFALSGLHIGIIIGVISFVSSKFSISRDKRYWVILIGLTLYFLGIKHSPSLIRAYIMGVIFLFGKILYENIDIEKSLAVSFIISLFLNPISIYEVSFKLSYLAVAAIIFIYPFIIKFYKGKSKTVKNIILIGTIQIFLTPILIKEFGTIQLFSIFSNLIIVPLGSLYITLAFIGLLFENFGLGVIIYPIVNIIFKFLIKIVEIFSNIPMLTIKYSGNKDNTIFLLFYVIIFGIIFYNKFKMEGKKDEKIYRRTKISQ